ncbi:uncharacterized protein (TIGR02117 family) [Rhizobium halophytocola]|uniref:Uncharacterized protein (TIGR02117 family) n=1 Tax=Rhizobium halophytocola TaxID=735519 RepID=A0ABS4DSL8_9HYPH|nr:uncharacterized protein (TIGR02117 family) [Rhizobium halophytocola]
MRRAGRGLLALVVLVVLALLLGTFVPRPLFSPGAIAENDEDGDGAARTILVLANPIHTDIALPLDARTKAEFGFLRQAGIAIDHPAARYLIIGWGGREFYLNTPQWADLKPYPVFRALTFDRSVMHVDLAGDIPADGGGVTPLALEAPAYRRMIAAMRRSFEDSRTGGMPMAGYGDYDLFFPANGWFNAVAGCNTWTAAMLRQAGITTGWWNPLPQTLAWSLKLYN